MHTGTESYMHCVVQINTAGDFIPQKHHFEGKIFSELHDTTRIYDGRPAGFRLQQLLVRGTWITCLQSYQSWTRFCTQENSHLSIPQWRTQVSKSSFLDKPLEDYLRKAKWQDLLYLTQSHNMTPWGHPSWITNLCVASGEAHKGKKVRNDGWGLRQEEQREDPNFHIELIFRPHHSHTALLWSCSPLKAKLSKLIPIWGLLDSCREKEELSKINCTGSDYIKISTPLCHLLFYRTKMKLESCYCVETSGPRGHDGMVCRQGWGTSTAPGRNSSLTDH